MTAVRSFRCRAILFDLDGVLVDSAECVEKTWREWAKRHHLDPDRVIALAHGRRAIETVRTPAGIESAHAAGMRVVAIATTYPLERLAAADGVVERLIDFTVVNKGDEIQIDIPAPPAQS